MKDYKALIKKECFPHVACADVLYDYLCKPGRVDKFTIAIEFMEDCGMIDSGTRARLSDILWEVENDEAF